MAVEALSRGIINKIMHTPITTLKSAARDPESTTVIELVRRLFNLGAGQRKSDASAAAGTGKSDDGSDRRA
jgi:glutamyl-tRNA reductase